MSARRESRPVVVWIATGGTIEAVGRDRMDRTAYGDSGVRVPPAEILAGLPEAAAAAEVRPVVWPEGADGPGGRAQQPPSHAWTVPRLVLLARRVARAAADPRVAGVVVSCGTNGLEETAFFLSQTVPGDAVVVVTGAMRPASALGGDGPGNLLNSVRVAADPHSAGRGVLVVMDDAVLAARDAAKTDTYRLDAFRSPQLGPIGFAEADGRIVHHRTPEQAPPPFRAGELPAVPPRVDLVVSCLGADGALVDAAVGAGAAGIVSAGLGAGYPTPGEQEALERASAAGTVVCQASRTGSGRVVATSGTRAGGFVTAAGLTPWKARLLLALALTRTREIPRIQALFDGSGGAGH